MIYTVWVCPVCGARAIREARCAAHIVADKPGATPDDLPLMEPVELVRKDVADAVADQLRLEVALAEKHAAKSDQVLMAYAREVVFG